MSNVEIPIYISSSGLDLHNIWPTDSKFPIPRACSQLPSLKSILSFFMILFSQQRTSVAAWNIVGLTLKLCILNMGFQYTHLNLEMLAMSKHIRTH